MSIHDKLAAVADELHLSGFGSELTEAVKRVTHLLADEIHSLGGGSLDLGALKAEFEKIVDAKLASLKVDQGELDAHIEKRFGELLAKATAADAGGNKTADEPAPQPEAPAQA